MSLYWKKNDEVSTHSVRLELLNPNLLVRGLVTYAYSLIKYFCNVLPFTLKSLMSFNAKLGGRAAQDWRVRGVKKRGAPFHCGARGKPCAAHPPKYEIS